MIEIDAVFSKCFNSSDLIPVPTGVGFCMYIRRDCLEEVGYFDEKTFGKGYGEENDWSQRAEKSGWVNYHQANVFAYHKGGVSFSDEQDPRKSKALELLAKLHPEYDGSVQDFIRLDPAKDYRIQALWTLFAETQLPKVVHVTHRLGGGVQQHVLELNELFHGEVACLQMMPLVDGASISLSILEQGKRLSGALSFEIEDEYERLLELLRCVGVSRVQVHHTMGLHTKLWSLAYDIGCEYDLTIHDYYWLNGNPTLIDGSARFAGDLPFDMLGDKCAEAYPLPVSSEVWRHNHLDIVNGASKVIFPSQDTCDRFTQYIPVEDSRRIVAWHPDSLDRADYPEPALEFSRGQSLKVLVIGAISREKGADVLEAVAKGCADCEFHLLGYAYRQLDSSVITHGPYNASEASRLVTEIEPDVVWYPAQWPETYSYTLSLALKLGLPVVVPNLGAFPERVAGRAFSAIVNWDTSVEELIRYWTAVNATGELSNLSHWKADSSGIREDLFYREEYLSRQKCRLSAPDEINIETLLLNSTSVFDGLSKSEIIFRHLWCISRLPIISGFVKMLPYGVKRSVKRLFSSKPVHEILSS